MDKPVTAPVLIVGGGIVGLSASLFLSHLGIRSLLVERHPGTSIHPRSRGFNARIMEIYRNLGLDEEIRAAGADLNLSKGFYRGSTLVDVIGPRKRKPGAGDARGGKPGDGLIAMISPVIGTRATQQLVEPILLNAARAQSLADVRFYTECVHFHQHEDGLTAELLDRESGEKSIVHAQYMLGVDGANSQVRQSLGIPMTGKGVLGHLINILFEADLRDFVRDREFSLCQVARPEVRGLFTSINNSNRWVFHLYYDPTKGDGVELYTKDRCTELVKLALGMPEIHVSVISILPWQSTVRVAETLQKGRVFLAGDAAHQMPPWRGQGATTGIADVHNLAWKLGAVLKGEADPALLQTYNRERLPVGRLAADMSGAAADEYGLFDMNWSAILKLIPMAGIMLGYGLRYASAAVVPDDVSQLLRIPWNIPAWFLDLNGRPGTRLPHVWVHRHGQRISTLDVCDKDFVILAAEGGGDTWRKAAEKTADSLNITLSVYTIGPSGDLVDVDYRWLYLAGLSATGALLIRPDGFVAWRAYALTEPLTTHLSQVMRRVLCR
ncbi:MAG: hypothetical protein HETSPECPRED_006884 [Heterodermia speciosa]|uniref:FAD-binding domain-containing protein n=1 Tax=Heterodermia speciosa TaxID=116794 RepID=A0A8H3FWB4_9LECA|nr:MAG: hypothetical protein HETSPECPRED_006884 [Heterodermia speciosa]